MNQQANSVVVDLGLKKHCSALPALLNIKSQSDKVTRAVVCSQYGTIQLNESKLIHVFRNLGGLCNLKTLIIELGDSPLPIEALSRLLEGPNRLKSIYMKHVRITGGLDHFRDFEYKLKGKRSLVDIRFRNCQCLPLLLGVCVKKADALQNIQISNSPIGGPNEGLMFSSIAARACNLKLINLECIPDISDSHIASLCDELASPQSRLEVLSIISSKLGEQSGRELATMLLVNTSIKTLTLRISWGSCGFCMSEVLKFNTTLETLILQLNGDDGPSDASQAVLIAEALCQEPYKCIKERSSFGTTSLKRLKLYLDIDQHEDQASIMAAFKKTLDCNETLETLVISDQIGRNKLTPAIHFRLRLNQSNVRNLFRRKYRMHEESSTATTTDDDLNKAIISQKEDVNVIFYILQNDPSLCLGWKDVTLEGRAVRSSDAHPVGEELQSRHRLNPVCHKAMTRFLKHGNGTVGTPKAMTLIRRRVKSILAPSA